MTAKVLLALFAASSLALPASAEDRGDGDEAAMVCHRVGKKAVGGFYPGVIIRTSTRGASNHLAAHGDIVVDPSAMGAFESDGDDDDDRRKQRCLINLAGDLFNEKGELVQPAPRPPGEGGDPGGPG